MGWQPMPRKPHGQDARATFTGWKPMLREILIRLALVAVLCVAVGFASRISPSYVAQDKSVLNRLDMWQGALVMMKDSPWIGWGNNNGGFAYINWYQPASASTHPVGFVNSFFDIGVEFGSPTLFVILWIGLFLLFTAFRHRKSHNTVPAFVILTAWGVANIWTSLWRETALWIIPAVCALYLFTVCWRKKGSTDISVCANPQSSQKYGTDRNVCATFARSFALSAGCVVVLLSMGWFFSGKYEWIARPSMGTDKITLIKRASIGDINVSEILIDDVVFGHYFGKTFRSIASTITSERFEVYPPWTRSIESSGTETKKIIFTGFQASWLVKQRVLPSQEIIIFYPTVFPPSETAAIGASHVSLYMPLVSAPEYNLAWRRWAQRNHVQIITAPREGIPL